MSAKESEMVRTALRQLENQDHKAAEETLRKAADAGGAEACRLLAKEYRHGFHFSAANSKQELHYTQLAAENGSLIDSCLMAFYAASGIEPEIKKNRLKAMEWLKPVQDHPAARAVCHLFGLGGYENDFSKAWDGLTELLVEQAGAPDEPDWLILFVLTAAAGVAPKLTEDLVDAQTYVAEYLLSACFRLSELNSKAGYATLGVFLATCGEDFPDPEQEREIVSLLEKGAAENDYDCMYWLGMHLRKADQEARGRELIRKAAEHEVYGAVCQAALMDLDDGADPEEVLLKLEKCIEMGENDALIPAAKLLETRDPVKSLEYTRRAADEGNTEGLIRLGDAYLAGWMVKMDQERAVRCYREAIARDDDKGHFPLGMALLKGTGTEADPFAAFGHLSYAAWISDDPHNWMELGRMLIEGIGCRQDPEEGLKWLNKAVERDYPPAMCYWCEHSLDALGEDTDDLSREILPMLKKAADLGFTRAQTLYGVILLEGIGCDTDPEKAAAYLLQASQEDDGEADYWLGFMYLHGIGVKPDAAKAQSFFTAALEHGDHPKAALELGKMALKSKDHISAFRLFTEAAKQDVAEAARELAAMYEKGLGMPKNPERAKQLIEHAQGQEKSN